ncbi:MAG: hypothetical protein FWH05_09035 [Oscillospiraceae bacterium]|nr:hypothetical protein [Oscillospiraceae bacterium]
MQPQESRFKVELYFDPNADELNDARSDTDKIFSAFGMPCLVSDNTRRIYGDSGDPKDFGKLCAAIARSSKIPYIQNAVSDAYFDIDNGDDRETLMTSFFGKKRRAS